MDSASGHKASHHNGDERLVSLLKFILVIVAVAALTVVNYHLVHANSATAAFTYLLLILALATQSGRDESIVASIASMLAYNFFFLPPVGALTIADPQNWVALFAFLATAIIASHLSSSVRARAEEAWARQQELQRMYDFSQSLMLGDDERGVADQATQQFAAIFGAKDVCLFSLQGGTMTTLAVPSTFNERQMQRAAESGEPWFEEAQGVAIIPIRLGGRALGSLGVAGATGTSEVALYAITQLIAIGMERAIAQQAAARLEATRESEQLKSVLLDALAHEFKTPLTSIKAGITSMLSQHHLGGADRELATVIDEEADRLTTLVSDAIELARVGSGPVSLNRQIWAVSDLIAAAARVLRIRLEGRELVVEEEPNLPPIDVDRKLTELALRQLLTNAAIYSTPGTSIRVGARTEGEYIKVQVSNYGPSISPEERELIFEKFYRGRETRNRVAGTGLGLSITRDIIAAQGGDVWVDDRQNPGVTFCFTLPTARGVRRAGATALQEAI